MRRLYHTLGRIEAVIAGSFLVAMVCLIFLGGVARLAKYPLNWTTDIATCLFAWACFMCADIAWRNDMLMSIQLATERLSAPMQRLMTTVNYVIISAFLVFLIGSGSWLAYVSRARSFQGLSGVSYSWVTASLPVGAAMLLITTLVKLHDHRRVGQSHRPVQTA